MKKTIQVINKLESEGIIKNYAVGGATALLFYTEPTLTFDLDVFVLLPGFKQDPQALVDLGALYQALASRGYKPEKEHVMIEGIPVQFIPAYNELVTEAVQQAAVKEYEETKVRVLTVEYLLAIMIDTNRPRDRERAKRLLEEVTITQATLDSILQRFSLRENWETYIEGK